MKFKEYVDVEYQVESYFINVMESFDIPAPVKTIINNTDNFKTSFTVNDVKYYFDSLIRNRTAIIIFYPWDGIDIFKERKSPKYVGKVFASVLKSVELLLESVDIDIIGFTAEYESLKDIYKLMEPILLKRFKDWYVYNKGINSNGKFQYTYKRKTA